MLVSKSACYYLLDLKTGQVAKLPLPTSSYNVAFSPNGKMIGYGANFNAAAVECATLRTFPLTLFGNEQIRNATPDTMGELLTGEGLWWSPDSKRVAWIQTDERAVPIFPMQHPTDPQGQLSIERYPLPGQPLPGGWVWMSGTRGPVLADVSKWPGWLLAHVTWLPDSRHLALQLLNRAQNRLVLLFADADTGQTIEILHDSDPSWINVCDDLHFFRKSNRFLWSSEKGGYRQLYLYGAKSMPAQLTSGDEASVALVGLDEENSAVYYTTYPPPWIDAHLKRVRFSLDGGKVEAYPAEDLTPTPGVHQTIPGPGFQYFADYISTANQPPQLHLYKSDGTKVATIHDPNTGAQSRYSSMTQERRVGQFEFVTNIKAAKSGGPSDDMPLLARIMKPVNFSPDKKYPALVYVYGGPYSGGLGLDRVAVNSWTHVPDLWLRVMCQAGYVIFCLDNRGSNATPRGHGFETPIYRELGRLQLADQLAGVKYLEGLGFIDTKRMGIWGGSFGGFMVLNAMLKAPGVFKAGAAFAPVTEWRGYDAIYTERYMGLPADNMGGYDTASVLPWAGSLADGAKLLLIHGAEDDNVHMVHSMQLLGELTKQEKECELMVYPGATHSTGFAFGNTAAALFQRVTGFFVQHLGMGPDAINSEDLLNE